MMFLYPTFVYLIRQIGGEFGPVMFFKIVFITTLNIAGMTIEL